MVLFVYPCREWSEACSDVSYFIILISVTRRDNITKTVYLDQNKG